MSTNTAVGAERPRPKRLYIPIAVRRDAARRQGGVCPCGCGTPCWADAKETKALVEWDHDPALELRDVLADLSDYVPAQLDPDYLVGRCEASHLGKTSGTGATTAGTDIGRIKKERRRRKALAQAEKPKTVFAKGRKLQGRGFEEARGKVKWPKRQFRKRI